jgi:hypothetical protein
MREKIFGRHRLYCTSTGARNLWVKLEEIMILGKWPTWCTNFLLCVYFYLQLFTCFEHTVLIIRRDKLYLYSLW